MIKIVELMPEDEFTDIAKLKDTYLHEIKDNLAGMGYAVAHVDYSEWYSFDRKLLVETNAPPGVIDRVLSEQNRKHRHATGVLVS